MAKVTLTSCLILGLLLSPGTYADLAQGQQAYSKGDYSAAYAEWAPLAGAGHVEAMVALGELYSDGKGVSKSWDLAYHWRVKAAESGHMDSQLWLGNQAWRGDFYGRKDLDAAKRWFALAAKQDSVTAIAALGHMAYESRDYAAALPYLDQACRRRSADACRVQWLMFRNGTGVLPDKVEATRKFSRTLALLLIPIFADQSVVKAYALYHFTNEGPEDAIAIEAATHLIMNPAEIAEAKELLARLKQNPEQILPIMTGN